MIVYIKYYEVKYRQIFKTNKPEPGELGFSSSDSRPCGGGRAPTVLYQTKKTLFLRRQTHEAAERLRELR